MMWLLMMFACKPGSEDPTGSFEDLTDVWWAMNTEDTSEFGGSCIQLQASGEALLYLAHWDDFERFVWEQTSPSEVQLSLGELRIGILQVEADLSFRYQGWPFVEYDGFLELSCWRFKKRYL